MLIAKSDISEPKHSDMAVSLSEQYALLTPLGVLALPVPFSYAFSPSLLQVFVKTSAHSLCPVIEWMKWAQWAPSNPNALLKKEYIVCRKGILIAASPATNSSIPLANVAVSDGCHLILKHLTLDAMYVCADRGSSAFQNLCHNVYIYASSIWSGRHLGETSNRVSFRKNSHNSHI